MLSTLKEMVAGNEVILPEYNYKTNSRFVLPYMIMVNINYSNDLYMYHLWLRLLIKFYMCQVFVYGRLPFYLYIWFHVESSLFMGNHFPGISSLTLTNECIIIYKVMNHLT